MVPRVVDISLWQFFLDTWYKKTKSKIGTLEPNWYNSFWNVYMLEVA